MTKQSSPNLSSLAARVLRGYEPTRDEIESLAASVLSQDERIGQLHKEMDEVVDLLGRLDGE